MTGSTARKNDRAHLYERSWRRTVFRATLSVQQASISKSRQRFALRAQCDRDDGTEPLFRQAVQIHVAGADMDNSSSDAPVVRPRIRDKTEQVRRDASVLLSPQQFWAQSGLRQSAASRPRFGRSASHSAFSKADIDAQPGQ